jgi:hypothetical protein
MVEGNFDQPVGLRMVKRRKRRAPDGLEIKDSAKMHPVHLVSLLVIVIPSR